MLNHACAQAPVLSLFVTKLFKTSGKKATNFKPS